MTSIDRINSINKYGLTPRNEDNSKLVKDNKTKVFFSEGFAGAIALYVDFNIVYEDIKNDKTKIENQSLIYKVKNSKNLQDYLGEGIYLTFNLDDIKNERNFENGCTSNIISQNQLKVLVLKKSSNNTTNYSRFEIVKYMMAHTNYNDIKYYGTEYLNSPTFEEATKRIQSKVKRYYENHQKEIDEYENDYYELIEMSLDEFINTYMK